MSTLVVSERLKAPFRRVHKEILVSGERRFLTHTFYLGFFRLPADLFFRFLLLFGVILKAL